MAVVVDTGVLLAAADSDDADHSRCAALLRSHRGELRVPAPVIPETSWQIERNLGPRSEATFLRLITLGDLVVIDLILVDWLRCIELIETYADLGIGLVDASVIAIAERLDIGTLATLNRRDSPSCGRLIGKRSNSFPERVDRLPRDRRRTGLVVSCRTQPSL